MNSELYKKVLSYLGKWDKYYDWYVLPDGDSLQIIIRGEKISFLLHSNEWGVIGMSQEEFDWRFESWIREEKLKMVMDE